MDTETDAKLFLGVPHLGTVVTQAVYEHLMQLHGIQLVPVGSIAIETNEEDINLHWNLKLLCDEGRVGCLQIQLPKAIVSD
jgi:hypothetical protein